MFGYQSTELSQAAYDRAWAKGWAAGDPDRVIKVNVGGLTTVPEFKDCTAGYLSFSVRQGTTVHDVVQQIHQRLPSTTTEHPIAITTVGPDPVWELREGDESSLQCLVKPYDAVFVALRIRVPQLEAERAERAANKNGIRKFIRKALGTDNRHPPPNFRPLYTAHNTAVHRAASPGRSGQPAPPPYDEAVGRH